MQPDGLHETNFEYYTSLSGNDVPPIVKGKKQGVQADETIKRPFAHKTVRAKENNMIDSSLPSAGIKGRFKPRTWGTSNRYIRTSRAQ